MPVLEVDRRYAITNANFGRVMSVVQRTIDQSGFKGCRCGKCICVIAAEALNLLPTHYYVDGGLEPCIGSPWVLVENAVAEAVERVQHLLCTRVRPTAG